MNFNQTPESPTKTSGDPKIAHPASLCETIAQNQAENRALLEKTYAAAEKTRKYILAALILNILVLILPLLGLVFIIPLFLDNLNRLNVI